jgi:hypothetical protein
MQLQFDVIPTEVRTGRSKADPSSVIFRGLNPQISARVELPRHIKMDLGKKYEMILREKE